MPTASETNHSLLQRTVAVMALTLFLGGAFSTASYYWVTQNDYVAKVNGQRISSTDYQNLFDRTKVMYTRQFGMNLDNEQGKAFMPMLRQNALNSLIDGKIVQQSESELGLTINQAEIDQEFSSVLKANYQDKQEQLERDLASTHMDIPAFYRELRQRILMRKAREAVGKKAQVSDETARSYYEQNKAQFQQPEMVEAHHILFQSDGKDKTKDKTALDKAHRVLAEIKSGKKSFIDAAKAYSEDSSNKETGGDLGKFKQGDMVEPFEKATWALKPGEISSAPVKTEFGYHLILRGKLHPAGIPPFEEARTQFENQLIEQEKNKAFEKWVKARRDKAQIVYAKAFDPAIVNASAIPTASTTPSPAVSPSAKP